MISLIEGSCNKVLNHGFLSWLPWWRVAAIRYWTMRFYHDFLDRGMLQLGTEPRVSIMISLIEGCWSKLLNHGFQQWYPRSTVAAVRYRTKGFYHYFFAPWSRDAAVSYWTKGFLSWFPWLRDAAVRYWTKVFWWFPWSRDATVRYWSKGFYHDFFDPVMLQ